MKSDNAKIRVLYVLDTLAIGGAEQVVLTLAKSIDRDLFEVGVVTLFSRDQSKDEPLFEEIKNLGIRAEKHALLSWNNFRSMSKFTELLRIWEIDIVHGHSGYSSFWSGLFTKVAGRRKVVHTRHMLYSPRTLISRFQSYLLVTVLTDRLIAISNTTYRNLSDTCRARPEKIVTLPNPIDMELFSPDITGAGIRKSLGIPLNAPVIGNASRFESRKGYDVLFRVAAKLHPLFPDMKVLVAGYGSEETKYKRIVAQLDLQTTVIFLGPRRDMPEVMAANEHSDFCSLFE